MVTLNVRGESNRRLTIIVQSYERNVAQDPFDANWLRCSVDVESGRFRASIEASFTTHDFALFLAELAQVVQRSAVTASFQTMEESLSFHIEADETGRAIIRGQLREIALEETVLCFAFDSDLSFLQETESDLRQVVAEFPVRDASLE